MALPEQSVTPQFEPLPMRPFMINGDLLAAIEAHCALVGDGETVAGFIADALVLALDEGEALRREALDA